MIIPGSTQVVDRATGKLVDCDATTCPNAIDGVNHAPFAAFGGWSGAINAAKDQKTKDAAYAFLSYMSQPEQANEDVTIGITGFNPYRTSQFENHDARGSRPGMSEQAAKDYLGAIEASLNSPNMVLDLRVPQNQRYQQIVLDTAIHRALAGETTPDEAITEIVTGWDEITEELGKDDQQAAYKALARRDQVAGGASVPQPAARPATAGRPPSRRAAGAGGVHSAGGAGRAGDVDLSR